MRAESDGYVFMTRKTLDGLRASGQASSLAEQYAQKRYPDFAHMKNTGERIISVPPHCCEDGEIRRDPTPEIMEFLGTLGWAQPIFFDA